MTGVQTCALPISLVFEKRSIWGIARAEVGLRATHDCDEQGWRMIVDNSLEGMRETIDITLDCQQGSNLHRERVSQGRGQRLKSWEYDHSRVLRERREPPADPASLPPQSWPVSSRIRIDVPEPAQSHAVTSPHALLALLDTLIDEPLDALIVHTDLNFYRLTVRRTPQALDLGEDLGWGEEQLRGRRSVHRLFLRAYPLDGNPEADDFSFLGLSGEIVIDVDRQTRLPLRISGSAPRLGNTVLRLMVASPAAPPATVDSALAQGASDR